MSARDVVVRALRDPRRERMLRMAIAYAQRPSHWSKAYALDVIAGQFGVDTKTVRRAVAQYAPHVPELLRWWPAGGLPTRAQRDRNARAQRFGIRRAGTLLDGLYNFFDALGYDVCGELPFSVLIERAEAAGIIRRKVDKSPK